MMLSVNIFEHSGRLFMMLCFNIFEQTESIYTVQEGCL